jgi:uncharacterized protein (TIGR03083 family)
MKIPTPLAPAVAWSLTTVRPTVRLVGRSGLPASQELEWFLRALSSVPADAPTACEGWTAHDLVAHMAAGSREMARLVKRRLDLGPGADVGPTIPSEEREPPYRALPDASLRRLFVREGLALTDAILRLQQAGTEVTVPFTGWDMTADEMIRHGRSELVLHRWDLVGSDATSRRLLDDPELVAHGRKVLARMGLPEAALDSAVTEGLSPADALLVLWGRDPEWWPGPARDVPAAVTGPVAQCGHERRDEFREV